MLNEEPSSQKTPSNRLATECLGTGFLIENGILSLDAPDSATFNFISSIQDASMLNGPLNFQRQTLLSQEANTFISANSAGTNVLPCPYFRPISLGSLSVELLPSGAGCGSSLLRAEKNGHSLLYAHEWSLSDSQALRSISIKPADTLLLRIDHNPSSVSHVSDKRETARFLEFCGTLVNAGTVVAAVVPAFGPQLILTQALQARGIPVRIESFSARLLASARASTSDSAAPTWMTAPLRFNRTEKGRHHQQEHSAEAGKGAVLILPKPALKNLRRSHLPEKTVWVEVGPNTEDHQGSHRAGEPRWLSGITYSAHFPISFLPDSSAFQELTQLVNPTQVLLAGHGASALEQGLGRHNHKARLINPFPETLF
jgi:hypothetical protein